MYLADSYSALGENYFKLNKIEQAIKYFLKALEIRRRRNLDRANILHGLGKWMQSFNLFRLFSVDRLIACRIGKELFFSSSNQAP